MLLGRGERCFGCHATDVFRLWLPILLCLGLCIVIGVLVCVGFGFVWDDGFLQFFLVLSPLVGLDWVLAASYFAALIGFAPARSTCPPHFPRSALTLSIYVSSLLLIRSVRHHDIDVYCSSCGGFCSDLLFRPALMVPHVQLLSIVMMHIRVFKWGEPY